MARFEFNRSKMPLSRQLPFRRASDGCLECVLDPNCTKFSDFERGRCNFIKCLEQRGDPENFRSNVPIRVKNVRGRLPVEIDFNTPSRRPQLNTKISPKLADSLEKRSNN